MKKIILLSILSLITLGSYAQKSGVKWYEGSFTQAIEKAKKVSKPIFVDCYTSWCGPCKHMANNVFTLPEAGKFFNSTFVNIKIDMEKGEGIQLKDKFAVKAFPTFLILDTDGKEIGRIVGGGELNDFIAKVKNAMSADKSVAALKAKYERTRSTEDAIAYMSLLESCYMEDEIVKFIEVNYDNFGRDLTSPSLWKYLSTALASDLVYERVMTNKYEFDEVLSRGAVNMAVAEVAFNKLVKYLTGALNLTLQEVKSVAKDLALTKEGRNLMLARTVSDLALAYAQKDSVAIDRALNMNFLNRRLTGHERVMLNSFVLQKGVFLTDAQKQEYKTKIK